MVNNHIEQLAARLESLGCEPTIQQKLLAILCFAPTQFEIQQRVELNGDTCCFSVHCVAGEKGLFDAIYYTAVLIKKPALTDELRTLDEAMQAVPWQTIYQYSKGIDVVMNIQMENVIALMGTLIETDTEGVLRYTHWAGTALEHLVPQLSQLKLQYEVSQRFYLLPNQPPIRFQEAFRFLQSRWMERKIQQDNRLLSKKKDQGADGSGAAVGKLLSKRKSGVRKQNHRTQ